MERFYGDGSMMIPVEPAVRLATVNTEEHGTVSYWVHNEEVYRLNEYEPVEFDIYGLPLGARWETNFFNWEQFKSVVLPADCVVESPAPWQTEYSGDLIGG